MTSQLPNPMHILLTFLTWRFDGVTHSLFLKTLFSLGFYSSAPSRSASTIWVSPHRSPLRTPLLLPAPGSASYDPISGFLHCLLCVFAWAIAHTPQLQHKTIPKLTFLAQTTPLSFRSIALIAYWTSPTGCLMGTSKCPKLNVTSGLLPTWHTHSELDPPLLFLTLVTQARNLECIQASSLIYLVQSATTSLNSWICALSILTASLALGLHITCYLDYGFLADLCPYSLAPMVLAVSQLWILQCCPIAPPQDEINLSSLAWCKGFSWCSPYLPLQSPPFPLSSIWSITLPHSSSHSQHFLVPVPLHLLIPFPGIHLCPYSAIFFLHAQLRSPFQEAF